MKEWANGRTCDTGPPAAVPLPSPVYRLQAEISVALEHVIHLRADHTFQFRVSLLRRLAGEGD